MRGALGPPVSRYDVSRSSSTRLEGGRRRYSQVSVSEVLSPGRRERISGGATPRRMHQAPSSLVEKFSVTLLMECMPHARTRKPRAHAQLVMQKPVQSYN